MFNAIKTPFRSKHMQKMKQKCANQQKLLNILVLVFFSLEALGKGNEASDLGPAAFWSTCIGPMV